VAAGDDGRESWHSFGIGSLRRGAG
jgi:hypothetical protein